MTLAYRWFQMSFIVKQWRQGTCPKKTCQRAYLHWLDHCIFRAPCLNLVAEHTKCSTIRQVARRWVVVLTTFWIQTMGSAPSLANAWSM